MSSSGCLDPLMSSEPEFISCSLMSCGIGRRVCSRIVIKRALVYFLGSFAYRSRHVGSTRHDRRTCSTFLAVTPSCRPSPLNCTPSPPPSLDGRDAPPDQVMDPSWVAPSFISYRPSPSAYRPRPRPRARPRPRPRPPARASVTA